MNKSMNNEAMDMPAAKSGRQNKSGKKIRNDVIFIAALLLAVSLIGACVFFFRSEGDTVKVTVDGKLYDTYPLDHDRVVEIRTGKDGEQLNVLVIKNGEAYVSQATCPDGICSSHRPISRDGESIACLPHKVAITVYSQKNNDAPDIVA